MSCCEPRELCLELLGHSVGLALGLVVLADQALLRTAKVEEGRQGGRGEGREGQRSKEAR